MHLTLILVCLLVHCLSCFAIQGELVSCPACKLNRLPEVKRFFREVNVFYRKRTAETNLITIFQPGHADSYMNLKVTFIHGKNPDLFIKNDSGEVIEKVDLSPVSGNCTSS